MKDQAKTKEQLINELVDLRQRVKERTRELRKTNNDLQAEMKEHKRREAASIQTEEIFSKLFNTIPDAIMIFDSDTRRFIDVNESALQMYGYTRDEFLKLNQSDISAEHEASDLSIKETLAGKRSWVPVRYHRKKDGTIFPVEISASTFPLGERQVLCAVIRDITKRKQAEEKVNQQNRFLTTVIESLSHPFVVINIEDYTIKLTNSAAATGNISETATCYSIMHRRNKPCGGQEGTCPLEEVKKSKKPITVEHLHYSEDGSSRNIEIHAHPVFDEEGNVVQIIEYSLDITERKQLEDALRESEEKYRSLFEKMLSGFAYCKMIYDENDKPIDWIYLEINDAFERITGIKRDVLGKKVTESIPGIENDVPKLFEYYGEVALTGKEAEFEIYLDTLRVWFHVTAYCPKKGYFVAVFKDITERKRTEDKLRESEHSLATAQRVAKVGSYEFDLKTNTITYSDEMCNILGLDKASYIPTAEGFEKIVHPNDRYKMSREAFDVALSTKKHEIKYRIIDQTTKEIKHIHNWEETIYDTDGTPSKITGVFQDITARKHAEEQIVSLAKFPSENPNPVLRVSRKGSILYANDAGKPLFDDWGSKISQPVPVHLNKLITESLDSGQSRIEEIKFGDRILSFIIAPIVDAGYVNLYGRDITARKLAEEELKKSREELKNLAAHLQSGREEERTSIAREIHDELGQALTALKMDLFWLRKRLPGDQRPYLKKIQSMVDLTDKTIVTMKRISTDLRPSMLDDLGLVAAIEWQAEEFQKRTGIKCDAAFDFEEIELDEERRTAIFRIFQETLTNIARHADATRARIYLRKRAKSLELEVRDNGKGITEEQISDPKAFGLIGIRERVQFVDGNVKISGAPNKGTMVLVKIPLPDIGAVG